VSEVPPPHKPNTQDQNNQPVSAVKAEVVKEGDHAKEDQ